MPIGRAVPGGQAVTAVAVFLTLVLGAFVLAVAAAITGQRPPSL
jgi:hypothetical protein